jgi:hypothetical protein
VLPVVVYGALRSERRSKVEAVTRADGPRSRVAEEPPQLGRGREVRRAPGRRPAPALDPPLRRPQAEAGELAHHDPAARTDDAYELASGRQPLPAVEEAKERDCRGEIELARGERERGRLPLDEPRVGAPSPARRRASPGRGRAPSPRALLGEPRRVDARRSRYRARAPHASKRQLQRPGPARSGAPPPRARSRTRRRRRGRGRPHARRSPESPSSVWRRSSNSSPEISPRA